MSELDEARKKMKALYEKSQQPLADGEYNVRGDIGVFICDGKRYLSRWEYDLARLNKFVNHRK